VPPVVAIAGPDNIITTYKLTRQLILAQGSR
jgi:hypothetical protein